MGTNQVGHSSRHHGPLHTNGQFGQWKHTSLSDSKYRETLAVIKDRTEKRQLEETSKRLSSALDQVMEVIAILDAGDGSIIYSNAVFSQVFGHPNHGAPKPKFMDLFECRMLATAMEQARSGHAWTGRSSLKTHAGKRITFEGTVSPVRTTEGVVESLVVRLRDITLEVEMTAISARPRKWMPLGCWQEAWPTTSTT